WAAFSLAATVLQAALVAGGAVSRVALAVGDARIAAALLILAAAWQLSPLKQACLGRCRSPARFLSEHWRPGAAGALRLGAWHGFYCIGCCWALMLLLFVGGVMSIAWIGGLALLVLVEKLAPARLPVRAATGVGLLIAGMALALS
ncbi:MAG: DUF2182 domain-containing protein, partial [Sphingomonadaceae bacterium]|nr:DUF2182 domain-containing protein [Sphingomonadaceae bacterium]